MATPAPRNGGRIHWAPGAAMSNGSTIDTDALGEFEDRCTIRYVRFYPVEVARVWKAVTTSEQLNVWLYPMSRVEPRMGGRCSFS